MENYGLDQTINGVPVPQYISMQLEAMDKQGVELEKEKIKNSYLKQLHNHLRLCIDAGKLEFNKLKFSVENNIDLTEKVN